jgi:SAM-dependent methyltransferase
MVVESAPFAYATAMPVSDPHDCAFYHVMEIPGHGVTDGAWDLRGRVEEYLGHVPLAGRRVLEIGPASGFVTFEMERRGAAVVAVELTDEHAWDFVPYPDAWMAEIRSDRRRLIERLKRAWWFAHAARGSAARVWYGNPYQLPDQLGHFDVGVLAAVLLHCHGPLKVLEQVARRVDMLVVTDLFTPALAGQAVCQLVPTRESRQWDTWWLLSPDLVVQFLGLLGFEHVKVTTHAQLCMDRPTQLFTVVAAR